MEEAAVRYCAVIEAAETYSREGLVAELVPTLAGVIAAAAAMPVVELPEGDPSDDYDAPSISEGAWQRRFTAIGSVLQDWDGYWAVERPLSDIYDDPRPEMWPPSLSDDLADVWGDLKSGLSGLADGGPELAIRWGWRFDFYSHWGDHATRALPILLARLRAIQSPGFE